MTTSRSQVSRIRRSLTELGSQRFGQMPEAGAENAHERLDPTKQSSPRSSRVQEAVVPTKQTCPRRRRTHEAGEFGGKTCAFPQILSVPRRPGDCHRASVGGCRPRFNKSTQDRGFGAISILPAGPTASYRSSNGSSKRVHSNRPAVTEGARRDVPSGPRGQASQRARDHLSCLISAKPNLTSVPRCGVTARL